MQCSPPPGITDTRWKEKENSFDIIHGGGYE